METCPIRRMFLTHLSTKQVSNTDTNLVSNDLMDGTFFNLMKTINGSCTRAGELHASRAMRFQEGYQLFALLR